MRALCLLALAAALGACAPFDLTAQRPYPCHRDGGEGQCPDQARCGVDEFCHPIGVAAAYPCEVSEDCEASWHCGVDHLCYDLADAGPVGCREDAGTSDCAPGWHCGVEHVCYPLATAGAVPCRRDPGLADCAPGWRCGLEALCHDQDAGAPYLCSADPDCERGWRCGQDGRCLDTAADALEAPTPLSSLAITKLSPAYDQPARLYATNDQSAMFSYPPPRAVRFAAVDPAGLWLQVDDPVFSMGGPPRNVPKVAIRAPLPVPPSALTIVAGVPYVLGADGLSEVKPDLDGGTALLAPIPFGLDGGALRSSEATYSVGTTDLIGFQGSRFAVMQVGVDAGAGPFSLLDGQGQPLEILDLAAIFSRRESGFAKDWLISTPRGLYLVLRSSGGGFVDDAGVIQPDPSPIPVAFGPFPNADCDGGVPAIPPRRLVMGSPNLPYVAVDLTVDPANPQVTTLQRDTTQPIDRCTASGFTVNPPAQACPGGGALIDVRNDYVTLETRCRVQRDGGLAEVGFVQQYNSSAGNYDPQTGSAMGDSQIAFEGPIPSLPFQSTMSTAGYVSEQGRMTRCAGGCSALTLNTSPTLMLGTVDGGLLAAPTTDGRTAFAQLTRGIGLTEDAVGPASTCAAIRGLPAWAVSCPLVGTPLQVVFWDRSHPTITPPPLAVLTDSLQVPVSPPTGGFGDVYRSQLAGTSDGGQELLVAAFDRLWAGDVSDRVGLDLQALTDRGPAALEVKMTPLPGSRISSLVVADPVSDGGTALLSGYLLTAQRVFRFVAENQARWRPTEVALPDGEPLALWATDRRARVGYRSGAVYSLPSRVQIGEELPSSEAPVSEYAGGCSGAFALGSHGVYQLGANPDGGVEGIWRPVPLPMLQRQAADPGWSEARLFETDDEVLLVTGSGTTIRIGDPGCRH